ncbi:MAG: DUF86 domain-containing protein [Planctomycetes bacterium]|nr:DUF86 domain-containing protein [Planctomycetota bacterium]
MPRENKRGPDDDRIRLQHMLEAARDVQSFIQGKQFEDLEHDAMLLRALMHAVQEIGEAAANTSDEGRNRVTGLPWGQIVAMRNVLVHVYWGIDRKRLWATAIGDVPVLIAAIEAAVVNWPLPEPPDQGTS